MSTATITRACARCSTSIKGLKVVQVVGNWDAGTAEKGTADAIATNGKFDGVMVQEGAIGALHAMQAANHPIVPIGVDAGNGTRELAAKGKFPGVTAAQAPAMSALALEAAVVLLQGNALPQKVFLPIPHKNNSDLVEGKDYLPRPAAELLHDDRLSAVLPGFHAAGVDGSERLE